MLLSLIYWSGGFSQTPGSYYGITLGGKSAHINVPDDTSLNFTGAISIEAWIKADSFKSGSLTNHIVSKHGTNGGYDLRCNINGGVNFRFGTSNGWRFAVSTQKLVKGRWYHVAGTYNGDSICVYINGKLNKVKYVKSTMGTSKGLSLKIGQYSRTGFNPLPGGNFDGEIDEVRIWSVALSEKTIHNWMCRKLKSTHPQYANLRANWRLDEGTGTKAYDLTSNNNDGTLSAAKFKRSSAPLGDSAVYKIGTQIGFKTSLGDVLTLNVKGASKALHLYQVAEPSIDQIGTGKIFWDNQYFGVFSPDTTNLNFDFKYEYSSKNTFTNNANCFLDVVEKQYRANNYWDTRKTTHYPADDSLIGKNVTAQELHLGKYYHKSKVIISDNDTVMCDRDTTSLTAYGNRDFTYQWYKDNKLLQGDTNATLNVLTRGKYHAAIQWTSSCKYQSRAVEIFVDSLPMVTLRPVPSLCDYDDTLVLSGGSPRGGMYSGYPVIHDSLVFPALYGVGDYDILYTYTDSNGCTNADTQNLHIQRKPVAFFKSNYSLCNNFDTLHLNLGRPKNGNTHGLGAFNNVFYADSINRKPGKYDLLYIYQDTLGCLDSAKGIIEVLSGPKISFIPFGDTCENAPKFNLQSTPRGKFFGKGVQYGEFSPAAAGAGSHLLTCSYTNIYGCTDTDSMTIKVLKVDSVSFTLSDSICINSDSLLISGGLPLGGRYGGAGVRPTGHFSPGKTTGPGLHNIHYEYTNSSGCTDRNTSAIKVLDTINLSINQPDVLCGSQTLMLNHVTPNGGQYEINGITKTSFNAKDYGAGAHKIEYRIRGANGCESRASFDVKVHKKTSVELTIDDEEICSNDSIIGITKVDPAGGILDGLGINGSNFNPSLAYIGINWITYSIIDSNNCPEKDSAQIRVFDVPKVSLAMDSTHCGNDPEMFFSNEGSPANGQYYINGSPVKSFLAGLLGKGQHEINYLFEDNNGCGDTAIQLIEVFEAPDKPIVKVDNNVLISNADSNNQWFGPNGILIDGENQKEYAPEQSGYYHVETHNHHCSSASDSVYFESIGIVEPRGLNLSVYPNPTQGILHIEGLDVNDGYIISVYSLTSQLIWQTQPSSNQESLKLQIPSTVNPGVYLLKIDGSSNNVVWLRFMLE